MATLELAVARDSAAHRQLLVIKRLLPTLSADRGFRAMFCDEARIAVRLTHPNIVRTYQTGRDGDDYFIAMEYLEGQPLAKVMQRSIDQKLPLAAALHIVAQVCAGLHYAHSLLDEAGYPLGIVHRDVSPQNVLITYAGEVKLVDFGIAQAAVRTSQTEIGILKGKLAYMSPEQAQGREVDGRADVFSLGAVFYEMLTGERIWGTASPDLCILRRLLVGERPPSARAIVPDLPECVAHVCQRALDPDRSLRYANALEMQKDVEVAAVELGGELSREELGEWVSSRFAEERRSFSGMVDRELRSLGATRLSDDPDLIAPTPLISRVLPTPDSTRRIDFSCPTSVYGSAVPLDPAYDERTSTCPTLLSSGTFVAKQVPKLDPETPLPTSNSLFKLPESRGREWPISGLVLGTLLLLCLIVPGPGSRSSPAARESGSVMAMPASPMPSPPIPAATASIDSAPVTSVLPPAASASVAQHKPLAPRHGYATSHPPTSVSSASLTRARRLSNFGALRERK